jgi:hypothetical protein
MPSAAVFLSYASEDRESVEAIKGQLEAAGVDVWFDKQNLDPGDPFEDKILRNIERCSLFVPIISRRCLESRRRFLFSEWKHALRVATHVAPNVPFIVPVALDDTPVDSDRLPSLFGSLNWLRLAGGRPTAEFVAAMRRLYRDYQQAAASAA